MDKVSIESLKERTTDNEGNPFEMLKKSFEIFDKKWIESQKAGPLDKKEMDTLLMESLDEGMGKPKKKK